MAQGETTTITPKRGPGRPAKSSLPPEKKRKISTTFSTSLSSSIQSPANSSPAPETQVKALPARVSRRRPLPTLPESQPVTLSADEYQSIASSAVLAASLALSRLRWIHDGVLERYWVKPEGGKNARPIPPNNPDIKLQKHRGPLRLRVEPHIFEAEMYVFEKPKPPVKQYVPPTYQPNAFGQPYRPQQPYQPQQNYQNRSLPPIQQQSPHYNQPGRASPATHLHQHAHPPPPPPPPKPTPPPAVPQQQEKKASPDPVIGMLATRASSDPELKQLMKFVASGDATQAQLTIFQKHIDELTKIVNEKKKKDAEEEAARETAKVNINPSSNADVITYDGGVDTQQQQQQQQRSHQPPTPYQQQQSQQSWSPAPPVQPVQTPPPPPAPSPVPVILAFTTSGATEDRFLFPQYSIIESLSPQHLLASFIVTRKGRDAIDSTGLDPETEYWQPVTFMVEVAYNREHLLDTIRKWVKPAEEVTKHMEEVMARATRVNESYLALRLPHKGSALAEIDDSVSDDSALMEEKPKPRKYTKKSSLGLKEEKVDSTTIPAAKTEGQPSASKPAGQENESKDTKQINEDVIMVDAAAQEKIEPKAPTDETTESGRPKRQVRKSVRISETTQ